MKKLTKVCALFFALALSLSACSGGGNQAAAPAKDSPGTAKDGNELTIEQASMQLIKAVDEGKYKLVSTEDLKAWIDKKEDMIIVDTMPAKSYDKNRIPGAVNAELPVKLDETTPEQKDAFIKALGTDKNKKVVLYCGFVKCERSHVGALIAKEAGFTNVYRQPGGIIAWIDAGYETEGSK